MLIILVALLALYVAWNLGANDVANSMGTSVGAKTLTLKQALIIAGILEFIGAVIFSQRVASTLATQITNPSLFASQPQLLLLGMVAVLLSCGLWLQIATSLSLPVASSHAVVGAIAGFTWVAVGKEGIDWVNLTQIGLAWLITPLMSALTAMVVYSILNYGILTQDHPLTRLNEWIPWLSASLLGVFGVIVFPTLLDNPWFTSFSFPEQDLFIGMGAIAVIYLTISSWKRLERLKVSSHDTNGQNVVEGLLGRFQVVSACFVAFAHGANDVGNAIAPLAAIAYVLQNNSVPLDTFPIPYWILIVGACGIVGGLAFQGKNVITTVGEGIIPLQPSSGFCAELATATTILLASRLGFPVSTSHALVGSVLGIGLIQNRHNLQFSTIKSVVLAWIVTVPITAIIGAVSFSIFKSILISLPSSLFPLLTDHFISN